MKPQLIRSILLAIFLAIGLTATLPTFVGTAPCDEIEVWYYDDASHTNLVGYRHWYCSGYFEGWGPSTEFEDRFTESCGRGPEYGC